MEQLDIKMSNKLDLFTRISIRHYLDVITVSFVLAGIWLTFSKNDQQNKNMSGIVYLVAESGRVQISDFKGEPYIANGYNTWYDKKGHKHWTKAPLMFKKDN